MKLKIYQELSEEVLSCKKCDLGCNASLDGHDPHVMGQGDLDSKVMFIAEAPGFQETVHKRPLTPPGKSGLIYEKVLAHLGVDRSKVYTTNTVLCRPPDNADPLPYQVFHCSSYLDRQIQLINPKLIVTFGRFAALSFLTNFKITVDHGKVRKSEKYNVDIFPLYHPAYVGAYAPADKRLEFKQDLNKLKGIIKKYTEEALV